MGKSTVRPNARKAKPSTLDRLCKYYLDQVEDLGIVQEVRYYQGEEGVIVWTVISAPPFEDDVRDPLYDAQINVLRKLDKPIIDFRVVNLEEFPKGAIDRIIPPYSRIIWKRHLA